MGIIRCATPHEGTNLAGRQIPTDFVRTVETDYETSLLFSCFNSQYLQIKSFFKFYNNIIHTFTNGEKMYQNQ